MRSQSFSCLQSIIFLTLVLLGFLFCILHILTDFVFFIAMELSSFISPPFYYWLHSFSFLFYLFLTSSSFYLHLFFFLVSFIFFPSVFLTTGKFSFIFISHLSLFFPYYDLSSLHRHYSLSFVNLFYCWCNSFLAFSIFLLFFHFLSFFHSTHPNLESNV